MISENTGCSINLYTKFCNKNKINLYSLKPVFKLFPNFGSFRAECETFTGNSLEIHIYIPYILYLMYDLYYIKLIL